MTFKKCCVADVALQLNPGLFALKSVRVSTVMSSCWPNCFAAPAMADWALMACVRWMPKSSRRSFVASRGHFKKGTSTYTKVKQAHRGLL